MEAAAGIDMRCEVGPELGVLAKPELLARALANLLRNAARYAGAAGPIRISAVREGEEVRLSVADCGPGVPAAELPHLFDPFRRLDESRDQASGGVGLGLTIVKTCVETCGGSVRADNLAVGGLEVTLTLRAATPPALSAPEETAPGTPAE